MKRRTFFQSLLGIPVAGVAARAKSKSKPGRLGAMTNSEVAAFQREFEVKAEYFSDVAEALRKGAQ